MGIGRKTLEQDFELFVQEPQALDRARGGLGLGLAIVKGLVSAHGGAVSASSEGAGRGAEFTVRLPYGDPSVAGSQPEISESSPPPPRRMLLVDDNVDAAELLAELLRLFGHEVLLAHDGPSALELAAEQLPDVALLDIGLPGMTGYELAVRLRAVQGLADIRLIATTGYGRPDDHMRSKEAGFVAHLVKPVDVERVQAALEAAAQRSA
jgi:CheY-like chemotaxis protein